MDKNKSLSPSDHDTLIRVETKFDQFVIQYAIDMKTIKDDTTSTIKKHDSEINALAKTMDEFKPVETIKRLNEVYLWMHDFKLTWKLMLTTATVIGVIVSFIVRSLLDLFQVIKPH